MPDVLNLAAYKFVPIDDPQALRRHLLQAAGALRGTVLLAPEGLNLVLAGAEGDARTFVQTLRRDARFDDLDVKESRSAQVPFRRLLVKVKREIIRLDVPAIAPSRGRAPAVAPEVLAHWLERGHDDAGRPVVMLDTRNGFEVDHGAFDGAIDWRLRKFSEFPAALRAHAGALVGKTVVTYCTGGIRCEKAALLMREAGIGDVWQLDGGILRYLERVQGAPGWRGRCFVFDERIALDNALRAA